MATMLEQIRAHDYWWTMSDDVHVCRRGRAEMDRLWGELKTRGWSPKVEESNLPYTWHEIYLAVSGQIFESYLPCAEPNKYGKVCYYHPNWGERYMEASRKPTEDELIKQADAEKILQWLESHP